MIVPRVAFPLIQSRIDSESDPFERNSHIVTFGKTGTGKSYLIRHGIVPIRPLDRIVVIDVKGPREIRSPWNGFGTEITRLPESGAMTGTGPTNSQYRLIVETDRDDAKKQVGATIDQVMSEGHWIVVIDESRKLTEREQLNLGSKIEDMVLRGRGLGITVILGAQSTAWAVSALKDQPAVMLIGMVPQQAEELSKIAGYGRELVPNIRAIKEREFLYVDTWGNGLIGLTKYERQP